MEELKVTYTVTMSSESTDIYHDRMAIETAMAFHLMTPPRWIWVQVFTLGMLRTRQRPPKHSASALKLGTSLVWRTDRGRDGAQPPRECVQERSRTGRRMESFPVSITILAEWNQ